MLRALRALKRRLVGPHIPVFPTEARHIEYSAILSADDETARPSDRLLDLALAAAQRARTVSMASVVARMTEPPYYPDVWPGEHYKLLAGLVLECRPELVIEIGTAAGLSALAMLPFLPERAQLATFDIVPWAEFPGVRLQPDDFADGTLSQIIEDLIVPGALERHAELFQAADLIFVDGPKDGRFEPRFLDLLAGVELPRRPIVVLDDIRVWNMLATWRAIRRPKLDLTSFGHWSGTGLVEWVSG